MAYTPVVLDSTADPLDAGKKQQIFSSATEISNSSLSSSPSSPTSPRVLGKLTKWRMVQLILHAIVTLSPLLFIVLAILAATRDGKSMSRLGTNIERALLLSPTVFPVLFAMFMGRFFRTIAAYKAERGIRLSTLERLIGCHSFMAAVERQVEFHTLDLLGLVIVLIWVLSPIGGQSALRILRKTPQTVYYDADVRYLSPWAAVDQGLAGASNMNSQRMSYVPLFMASIMSAKTQQDSSMDLWGNIKIPVIRSLEPLASATAMDGVGAWRKVPQTGTVPYSSLIGIPVAGIPLEGSSNFTMESMYWDVNCSSNYVTNLDGLESFKTSFRLGFLPIQEPKAGEEFPRSWNISFISLTGDRDAQKMAVSNCTVAYEIVESKTQCNGRSCHVDSMRFSTNTFNESRYRNNIGHEAHVAFPSLPASLAFNQGSSQSRGSSPVERWMNDSSRVYGTNFNNDYENLWQLKPDAFAKRLGVVLNTFWQSTYAAKYLGGNLPTDLASYNNLTTEGNALIGAVADDGWREQLFGLTSARAARPNGDKYHCNWTWVFIFLLTSAVLQLAALGGLVLKYLTLAPDILGYVSSYTRDNPHAAVFPGGSHLDGPERARKLKNVVVRLADVRGDADVGHIAFAVKDVDPNGSQRRVTKGRLYD
ncbi:MAG: hypothetical protein M1816_002906 [Peltula sp. TS41687]|nr:MAG: hypothetical protein M1816_002906 [Peltula sp. TS41687]